MSSKRPQTLCERVMDSKRKEKDNKNKGKNGNQKNKAQLQARNLLTEARLYEEKKAKAEAEAAAVAEAAAGAEAGAKGNVDVKMAEKELEDSISAITNDLIEGNPIDIQELVSIMKVMFLTLFGNDSRRNVNKIVDKIEKIEEKVEEIEEKIEEKVGKIEEKIEEEIEEKIEKIEHIEENVNTLDKALVGIQVEAFSTKYLLKNVPTKMKVGKKKEDIEDTKDTVEEILNIAEMNLKSIDQFYRMYSKENDRNIRKKTEKENPNILLKFTSHQDIYSFIEKLKEIKKVGKFKNLQFEKCVPPCLMNQWNDANLEAYRLRKDKSMLTKTIIRNNQIQLFAKTNKQDSFVKLNFEKRN